ncbi:MAG: flagellar motor switch protein FliG [Hydrogenophilales bacterium CG03_land_8_20_14_0_80_62_28]|nr:flagellar motor switch protein FliG [Betaproteobacteria bacterium]OIO77082.1 MAG: flagellar motor switch protein FliG [Hydrogenophilaceae bacterium CG1_02_62_390]PIV23426.1 MAG: flagellar motor switch protein FliG [Hydrogenophilales bacterium CG03_land_8_20_14_0_80_62_28]PIW37736.1 MAG: flagellar motor switch protein FliG [Hydrogenophilales bacterium CG15_BIG_FIL_POST_REV_8_21_14_020_62_31]PIW71556.1 MAG: flagellar motor switch protein FliG [Hydrogenophilales bacterium CG12_big_fil_rev_8_21_
MSDEGVHNSAVLMLAIGHDEAAEVFKYLGPKEVQRLGVAMAGISNTNRDQIEAVLKDFRKATEGRVSLGDSDEYIRTVLTKALGDDKAAHLLDRILQGKDNAGIESLKWMDAGSVAEMIRNEHPQIIAAIMAHLDADQASAALNQLPERLRNDVMLRIATLESVQPMALRELNEVLTQLLSGGERSNKAALGGVKVTADILNYMGGAIEASVLAGIRENDPELAQKIQDQMFTFDNVLDIDDRSVQLLLREVQSESLIIALKGTSEELKEKIFKNMSSRAAESLKEDLEAKGPVRLSEVEAEQKEILKVIRRLADEGQIILGGKGGDEGMIE